MTDSNTTFQWQQLARRQKVYILAAALLVGIVVVALVWDGVSARLETREYERQAANAARDKDAALSQAANIASQVKQKEEELNKVEGKRDAKSEETNRAKANVDRDRTDYNAARDRHTRPDQAPSSDDLCRQLAALGHPCYPT